MSCTLSFLVDKAPFSSLSISQLLGWQNRNGLRSKVCSESQFLLFLTIYLNLFLINRGAGHFFAMIIRYTIIIKLIHTFYLLCQLWVILELRLLNVRCSRINSLLNSYLLLLIIFLTRRDVWWHSIILGQILSHLYRRSMWAINHLYPIELHFLIAPIIAFRWVLYCGLITIRVILRIFTIDF